MKKTKVVEKEVKPEVKPVLEAAPVTETSPVAVTPPVSSSMGVVVEPVASEVKPAEAPAVGNSPVKEGELASAIADLAKVVDSQSKPEIKPEPKEFVPVGVTQDSKTDELKPEVKPSPKGQIIWVILSFLMGFALGILLGYLLWGRGEVKNSIPLEKTEVVTPTKPAATGVPVISATPAVKIDRSKLKVQVLNGSGGKGVAAKAKDLLESMGYKSVAAGNAEKEDYKVSEISIKESKMTYFETLKADLASKYQVATQASTLAETSSYDAVVTIGAK